MWGGRQAYVVFRMLKSYDLLMLQATLDMLGLWGAVKHRCVTCFDVFYSVIAQKNAYPWIAALVRDEDSNYVNTQCSGTLVCINW